MFIEIVLATFFFCELMSVFQPGNITSIKKPILPARNVFQVLRFKVEWYAYLSKF